MPNTVLLGVLACVLCCQPAFSAAITTRIGGLEVHTLVDKQVLVDAKAEEMPVVGIGQNDIDALMPSGRYTSQILAYLVRMDGKNYLFDAGLPLSAGNGVLKGLKEIGVQPGDVDAVVFTHLHPDHIGGMIDANDVLVYPNARHYVAGIEYDWWTEGVKRHLALGDGSAARFKSNHELTLKCVAALKRVGKEALAFSFGSEILPGVVALGAVGHTPGHTIYELASGGGKLLIVGDIMHVAPIQVPRPEISVTYDVDQDKARESRRYVMDMAAERKIPIAGMHMPLPGIWRLEKAGDGFALRDF